MSLRYFKRFRMELDLRRWPLKEPILPVGYHWNAWDSDLLERHAITKFASFRGEVDATVFPCLSDTTGCRRLMQEIAARGNFLPGATWLISYRDPNSQELFDCGTIQGLSQRGVLGSIQNVGIVPEHRGLGLGRALVSRALCGFRAARIRQVYLEVTAQNTMAVELYRSVGFHLSRTLYKAVEVEPTTV